MHVCTKYRGSNNYIFIIFSLSVNIFDMEIELVYVLFIVISDLFS